MKISTAILALITHTSALVKPATTKSTRANKEAGRIKKNAVTLTPPQTAKPSILRRIANSMEGLVGPMPLEQPWASKYWEDPRIHSFGNVGIGGTLHSLLAPFFTLLLDVTAYEGENLRQLGFAEVAKRRSRAGLPPATQVVDLGCGTGTSTRELKGAFPLAEVVGVDTSEEMLAMAKALTLMMPTFPKKSSTVPAMGFLVANAESTGLETGLFDVVSASFLFHEAPQVGRKRILAEAKRLLKPGGTLVVLDICRDYEPSPMMLVGEPYIKGYLRDFGRDVRAAGFGKIECAQPIPGRAETWICTRL